MPEAEAHRSRSSPSPSRARDGCSFIDQRKSYGPARICRIARRPGQERRARNAAGARTAWPTASPFIRSSPRTATSTSAATAALGSDKKRRTRIIALHGRTASRRTRSIRSRAQVIIEWDSDGHNGAAIAFGHDGMLYVTSGDGTSDSDTNVAGQDMTTLLGQGAADRRRSSRPRASTYSRPEGQSVRRPAEGMRRPETWAYGLRNPWRMTVDPQDRPRLGRPERPGPVGAGLPRPARATTTAGACTREAIRSIPIASSARRRT